MNGSYKDSEVYQRRIAILKAIRGIMDRHSITNKELNSRINYPITPYGWSIEELERTKGEGMSVMDLEVILRIVEQLTRKK